MAQWGRTPGAGTLTRPEGGPRYGRRSLVCAGIAFGSVIAAMAIMIAVPSDAPEPVPSIMIGVFLLVFAVAAPVIHITGIVFGLMGLTQGSGGVVSALVGVVLNLALVGIGVFFAFTAMGTIGAFT